MFRNIAIVFVITLALPIVTAYGAMVLPPGPLGILPEDCQVTVDEEIRLELEGHLPSDMVVSWEVDQGGISYVLPGRSAVFVAPSTPAVVTVTVSISPAIPGFTAPITRQCTVK